jgi:hypothetical protein
MKAKSWFSCILAAMLLFSALPAGASELTPMGLPKPTKLVIQPEDKTIEKGETLQLTAVPVPAGADPRVTWTSSDVRIARVSSTGLVTARKVGRVVITARSKAKTSVYTKRTIRVVDTKTVTSVSIANDETVLLPGGTLSLQAVVLPVTAPQQVTWFIDKTSVAEVSTDGVVTAHQAGSATVTATAVGGKQAKQRIVVLEDNPVTELPSQITSTSGISGNFAKLDAVLGCATDGVDALKATGAITSSEAAKRKAILLNAFRMARFPWMSGRTVKYWNGNYWYLANVVYYGIPYTQRNRTYNVSRSLKSGLYKMLSGDAHYTATLPNVSYPGNDCSAFVSMSIWGSGTSHSFSRSREIRKDSGYKTVANSSNMLGYQKLRPGDILVKNGHVVMFLYYTNSFHSRAMIIQQGGRNALNTVGCDVKPMSYYGPGNGYIGRRKHSFA